MRFSVAVIGCVLGAVACRSRALSMGGWEGHENIPCDALEGGDRGAAGLPRVTEHDWSVASIDSFVSRTVAGTVAVDLLSGTPRLLPDCRLAGKYTEALGETGSGRFWATSRPLFGFEELPPECFEATHAIAAYVRRVGRFEALAVPLPCPFVDDASPARGCIGRGLTGRERLARARAIIRKLETEIDPFPSVSLELYALAPDASMVPARFGLSTTRPFDWRQRDCVLASHMGWVSSGYDWSEDASGRGSVVPRPRNLVPEIDIFRSGDSCLYRPIFTTCFPELFRPKQLRSVCWESVELEPSNPQH